MKLRYIQLIIAVSTLFIASCKQDFLETNPSTEFSELAVWNDPALVETFINNIYFRLDEPLTDGRFKANIVDEADYRGNSDCFNFNNCVITSDVLPSWSTSRYRLWADIYKSIRYCNIFFEKIEKVPFSSEVVDGKVLKDRMNGEVHFLRGMFYFELVSAYGGIPIITDVFSLNDEFKVQRNTLEESIKFIVDECDKAASLLPDVNSGANNGRATKGAALALKSRVLLYAASDLYNTNVFSSYEHPELIRYTSGDRSARWNAAKDAAKAVIDLNRYQLYKAEPAANDSIAQNLVEIFLSKQTIEDIFIKFFTTNMGQAVGLRTNPNGYHGWGTNAPIGNIVDDFEMADGTRFNWSNPVHAATPYAHRDQRLYATILYDGASWRQRPDDAKGIDPYNKVQTGVWETWSITANKMVEVYGVDTRKSTIEDWNGSYTGYYLRKYIDPAVDAQYVKQSVTWRFFRYAEILLNYAEACIELGQDDEAKIYINKIRKRAGQPPITETGNALRERYRNERRIELCFEDHRFFDVRRWVIGPKAYTPATAANVRYKLNADHTTAKIPTITHAQFQTRKWIDKAYFLPIMRTELNKNSSLIQNPGY